jgi:hypothetical protein
VRFCMERAWEAKGVVLDQRIGSLTCYKKAVTTRAEEDAL